MKDPDIEWYRRIADEKYKPKREEKHGRVTYEVTEEQDIPQHLIDAERRKARLRRR